MKRILNFNSKYWILLILIICQTAVFIYLHFLVNINKSENYLTSITSRKENYGNLNPIEKKLKFTSNSILLDIPGEEFIIVYDKNMPKDSIYFENNAEEKSEKISLNYTTKNDTLVVFSESNRLLDKKIIISNSLEFSSSSSSFKSNKPTIAMQSLKNITVGPFTKVRISSLTQSVIDQLNINLREGAVVDLTYLSINNLNSTTTCGSKLEINQTKIKNFKHISFGGTVSAMNQLSSQIHEIENATITQSNDALCNSKVLISVSKLLESHLNSDMTMNVIYEGDPILKSSISKQNVLNKFTYIKKKNEPPRPIN